MKLLKVLMIAALLPVIGSALATDLRDQGKDTLDNIQRFGYTKSISADGSDDTLVLTPKTVTNVLHQDFKPDSAKWVVGFSNPTKAVKNFLLAVITQAKNKFPGRNDEEKKAVFIEALKEKAATSRGSFQIELKTYGFKRDSLPSDTIVTRIATYIHDELKGIATRMLAHAAVLEAAREAGKREALTTHQRSTLTATTFAQQIIDLYRDGILVDDAIDLGTLAANSMTAYPLVIESLKRLGVKRDELAAALSRKKR